MFAKPTLFRALSVAAVVAFTAPTIGAQTRQHATQSTRGGVISALNNIDANISRLNALNNLTVSKVRVVNISNLFNKNNVSALNNALNRNHTQILNLRDVLNNNEVIKNALNSNNVALDRVVAVNVLSGGGVTVFRQ